MGDAFLQLDERVNEKVDVGERNTKAQVGFSPCSVQYSSLERDHDIRPSGTIAWLTVNERCVKKS